MNLPELQARVRDGVPLAGAWGVEVLEAGEGAASVRIDNLPAGWPG